MVILFAVGTFSFLNEAQSAKPYYKFVTTIANNKAQISSQAQYEQVLTKMYEEGYVYSHTASVSGGFNTWPETFIVFVSK